MKILNNEIVVHRNETFSIDKIVQNKDGSPYIISNKLSNPYFLISISTTRYAQNNRYIKNYWLDLSKYPRFTSTNAVNLLDIKQSANSAVPIHSSFEEITYSEVLQRDLKVMDSTATALCKDNNIPLVVFGIADPENIVRAVKGEKIGTIVS